MAQLHERQKSQRNKQNLTSKDAMLRVTRKEVENRWKRSRWSVRRPSELSIFTSGAKASGQVCSRYAGRPKLDRFWMWSRRPRQNHGDTVEREKGIGVIGGVHTSR